MAATSSPGGGPEDVYGCTVASYDVIVAPHGVAQPWSLVIVCGPYWYHPCSDARSRGGTGDPSSKQSGLGSDLGPLSGTRRAVGPVTRGARGKTIRAADRELLAPLAPRPVHAPGRRGLTRTTPTWRGVPKGATSRAPFLRPTVCVELCIVLRIAHLSVRRTFASLYAPFAPGSAFTCVRIYTPASSHLAPSHPLQRDGSRTQDEGVKRNRSCTDASSAEHPRGGFTPRARHRLSHPAREKRMIANAPV